MLGQSGFYVTQKRDSKTAWLLGPFPTKEAAEAHIDTASDHMVGGDPFAWFDGFGTSSITRRPDNPTPLPAGRLNAKFPGLGYGPVVTPATAPMPISPNWNKNYENAKDHQSSPCAICGKTVSNGPGFSIAVDATTSEMLSNAEAGRRESEGLAGEKCCYYPVGPECAKRPDVRPYVAKTG